MLNAYVAELAVEVVPVVEHETEQQDDELEDAQSNATYVVSPMLATSPQMMSTVQPEPELSSFQPLIETEVSVVAQSTSLSFAASKSFSVSLSPMMQEPSATLTSRKPIEASGLSHRPRSISDVRSPDALTSSVVSKASSQASEPAVARSFESVKELLREKLANGNNEDSYAAKRGANKHEYHGGPLRLFRPGFSKTDKLNAITLLMQYVETGDYRQKPAGRHLQALNDGALKKTIEACLKQSDIAPKTIQGLLDYIQQQHQSRNTTVYYKK